MHMPDSLLCNSVAGVSWVASAALAVHAVRKVSRETDPVRLSLMAPLGAFVFAAQMLNVSIPATGSSGHFCGGILLAAILGPYAGYLTLCAILAVQAVVFADGGLLSLGGNILNMGFLTCFLAYGLVFRPLAGDAPGRTRLALSAIAASVVGLQLGAFSVVLQAAMSGINQLPFASFAAQMLPIHLAIGLLEGIVTATVLALLHRENPMVIRADLALTGTPEFLKPIRTWLGVASALMAGALCWFASSDPDGLEWSVARLTDEIDSLVPADAIRIAADALQSWTAILPDYDVPLSPVAALSESAGVAVGTSVAGLLGAALVYAGLAAFRRGLGNRHIAPQLCA